MIVGIFSGTEIQTFYVTKLPVCARLVPTVGNEPSAAGDPTDQTSRQGKLIHNHFPSATNTTFNRILQQRVPPGDVQNASAPGQENAAISRPECQCLYQAAHACCVLHHGLYSSAQFTATLRCCPVGGPNKHVLVLRTVRKDGTTLQESLDLELTSVKAT